MIFTFLFIKLWFLLLGKQMLYFNMYSDAPPFFFPVNRYGTALVMKVLLLYSLFHKQVIFMYRGCGLSKVFNSQQYLRKISNKIHSAL
jgi:hypothetical protein